MLQSTHKDTPNTLSGHHKPKDLTIQIKNSFIFINIFKTYFLINSVSLDTLLTHIHAIGATINKTLIHPVIINTMMTFLFNFITNNRALIPL